jgi:hypothetical protein
LISQLLRRIVMDEIETDIEGFGEGLDHELCDEALEALDSSNIAGAYTLGACTGLSVCPA